MLRSEKLAKAFTNKGTDAVVGWDESVSVGHTDAATERLLAYLVTDGLSIEEAVDRTMEEVGPDPVYGARLLVYPSKR